MSEAFGRLDIFVNNAGIAGRTIYVDGGQGVTINMPSRRRNRDLYAGAADGD